MTSNYQSKLKSDFLTNSQAKSLVSNKNTMEEEFPNRQFLLYWILLSYNEITELCNYLKPIPKSMYLVSK